MIRTTIYLDENLLSELQKIANSKKWSITKAISVLLEYAIKEKQRKYKHKQNDNT